MIDNHASENFNRRAGVVALLGGILVFVKGLIGAVPGYVSNAYMGLEEMYTSG